MFSRYNSARSEQNTQHLIRRTQGIVPIWTNVKRRHRILTSTFYKWCSEKGWLTFPRWKFDTVDSCIVSLFSIPLTILGIFSVSLSLWLQFQLLEDSVSKRRILRYTEDCSKTWSIPISVKPFYYSLKAPVFTNWRRVFKSISIIFIKTERCVILVKNRYQNCNCWYNVQNVKVNCLRN